MIIIRSTSFGYANKSREAEVAIYSSPKNKGESNTKHFDPIFAPNLGVLYTNVRPIWTVRPTRTLTLSLT